MNDEMLKSLVEEFKTLNEKTNNLKNFLLDNEKIKDLDDLNKDLCIAQLKAMEAYISILSIRIGLNNKPQENDK